MSLPLHPQAGALAASTKFVDSLGGPLVVMSASLAPTWLGTSDTAGAPIYGTSPCDYDRACAANDGVIDVGTGKALTLAEPSNSGFVRRERGALIVRWVGADDAETLISAALALGDDDFKTEIGELAHAGGELWMFDSTAYGPTLGRDALSVVDLPAGTYRARMCTEWAGKVTGADGGPHDVMVQVVELARV